MKHRTRKPFDVGKANRETIAISDMTKAALAIVQAMPHDDHATAFWELAIDWAYEAKPAMVRKGLDKFKKRLEKKKPVLNNTEGINSGAQEA